MRAYLAFRLARLSTLKRWIFLARFLPRVILYIALDFHDRHSFNKVFYHVYRGVESDALDRWAEEAVESFWAPRLLPEALSKMRYHLDEGHQVVLISGGLEPILEPLARSLGVHALVGVKPESHAGRLTGQLVCGALSGRAKSRAVQDTAGKLGISLSRSYAYADSIGDREFLEAVQFPFAVNPDRRLRQIALDKEWPIVSWKRS